MRRLAYFDAAGNCLAISNTPLEHPDAVVVRDAPDGLGPNDIMLEKRTIVHKEREIHEPAQVDSPTLAERVTALELAVQQLQNGR